MKKTSKHRKIHSLKETSGFTLVEMMFVVVLIGLVANFSLVSVQDQLDNAKYTAALGDVNAIHAAVIAYYADIGFYPPDSRRGFDPGLMRPLPNNDELGMDCNTDPTLCAVADDIVIGLDAKLPDDWMNRVRAHWHGPYISKWPKSTPWGGKYDYNAWSVSKTRYYGCTVDPNTYISIEGDYNNDHPISTRSEEKALRKGLDSDHCLDGEVMVAIAPAP